MALVVEVLRALSDLGVAGPGDLVASTRIPRYKVLSIVKCLEELGLIEPIYAKGSYRVYRVTLAGSKLLELLASGATLRDVVERATLSGGRVEGVSGFSGGEESGEVEAA